MENIKMNIEDIKWGAEDCTHVPQNWGQYKAVVNSTRNLQVP
jgi:hypothetical protein